MCVTQGRWSSVIKKARTATIYLSITAIESNLAHSKLLMSIWIISKWDKKHKGILSLPHKRNNANIISSFINAALCMIFRCVISCERVHEFLKSGTVRGLNKADLYTLHQDALTQI